MKPPVNTTPGITGGSWTLTPATDTIYTTPVPADGGDLICHAPEAEISYGHWPANARLILAAKDLHALVSKYARLGDKNARALVERVEGVLLKWKKKISLEDITRYMVESELGYELQWKERTIRVFGATAEQLKNIQDYLDSF